MINLRTAKWASAAAVPCLVALFVFSLYNWTWMYSKWVLVDVVSGRVEITLCTEVPAKAPYGGMGERSSALGVLSHPYPQDVRYAPRFANTLKGNPVVKLPIWIPALAALLVSIALFWADYMAKHSPSARRKRRRTQRVNARTQPQE